MATPGAQASKKTQRVAEKSLGLSVVLAVHNESAMLAKCLKAVEDLWDELVIVDGESTDDTVKIAKSFGARVISTTNKPNFHINKQMAIDAAKFELVFQLDADEITDALLHEFLAKLKAQDPTQASFSGWWVRRRNWFLGQFMRKGGQYPDPVIRIFRHGKGHLPQKDVHEQIAIDGDVGWADGHLLHYSNPTFADYLRKWNAYTSLTAQHLQRQGKLPSLPMFLEYCLWKPVATTVSLWILHKGFMDGWSGFFFALWSGLHHLVAYLKLWELTTTARTST